MKSFAVISVRARHCPLISLLLIIVFAGCVTSVTPKLVTLRVSVVSTGLSASYRFAEEFRASERRRETPRLVEADFNAVMQTGGGSDSCPYIVYLLPERKVEDFVAWVELCADNLQREWMKDGGPRLYRVYFALVDDAGKLEPLQCYDLP